MLSLLSLLIGVNTTFAFSPDWSDEATLSLGETRANIYNFTESELKEYQRRGYTHAAKYPVEVTGLLIPYRPFKQVLTSEGNPIKKLFLEVTKTISGFKSEKEFYEWLGLSPFNPIGAKGIYDTPRPEGHLEELYLGASIIKTPQGEGLTFSCFACHATNLFGTTVMGLTNKRPHSNKLFWIARKTVPKIPAPLFQLTTKATAGEVEMFKRTKKNLLSVDSVVPQVHGLDTSLPHTALSLSRRNEDDIASKNPALERDARYNELQTFVADSKPMPWWNLKYKTRWLSDGSIVSGNPIFTNILWNELGRGTDLVELEGWMKKNDKVVKELTAAAFATAAPRYVDFFPVSSIDLNRAKKGEKLFNNTCLKCHGEYQKAWSLPHADQLSDAEKLVTTKVIYHEKTPVIDVGTDPNRYMAMSFFADALNNLKISKWMGTVVEPQEGYVPPPLEGIWARYPYFHNNSVPTLCAVLSQVKDRPRAFVLGPAENINTDFDQECNGYPTGDKIPRHWRSDKEATIDTRKSGLRNVGHTKMLLNEDGTEKFSKQDKLDLIQYLKTL